MPPRPPPRSSARCWSDVYPSLWGAFSEIRMQKGISPPSESVPILVSEASITEDSSDSLIERTVLASALEILTADDIRRSGGQNIPEVLRQVNGVNVVQKTANSYDVSIRGYNQHWSQRLLVLVNGRQVYLDHYGYTDWASIPVQLEEIRQIEVVKGPNTALFGFNAVNITLGLPFLRISPDHGTNNQMLGQNKSDPTSFKEAINFADKIRVN